MDLNIFLQEELYNNNNIMRTTVLIFATYGFVSFIRDIYQEVFKPKPKPEPEPVIIIESESESDTDSDLLIINDISTDSESDHNKDTTYIPGNMIRKRRRTTQN
jgi:hypothetical protein